MTEPIDVVIARLLDAHATGHGRWTARCPAHPDRRPSLSIRAGDDGQVLLHCFAGCATERVLTALGLAWTDLFPCSSPSGWRRGGRHRRESDPWSRVVREARRQAARLAPYREAFALADLIRDAFQCVARLRQWATMLGDCDNAWILLAAASELERDGRMLEIAADDALAGARRRA